MACATRISQTPRGANLTFAARLRPGSRSNVKFKGSTRDYELLVVPVSQTFARAGAARGGKCLNRTTSRARASAFWRDRRGVSTLEFAITLPVLVLIFLGMIEFGEVFTVDRRLTIVANSAADLVARTRTISDSDLSDIAGAVDEIVRPYPPAPLGLVVSSIVTDEDNNASVAWSWSDGATARTAGAAFTLPEAGLTEPNTSIIVAEVTYLFTPSVGLFLTGGTELEAAAYYRPRLAEAVEKR